jgi:hypothetical protein
MSTRWPGRGRVARGPASHDQSGRGQADHDEAGRHRAGRGLAAVAMTAALGTAAAALAGCGSIRAPGGSGAAGTDPSGGTAASQSARPVSASASASAAASGPAASASARSPGATASATASASLAPCAATGLQVHLDTSAAGVAAGTYYVPLEFVNATRQACALSGYPAVALTSGMTGQQIGTEAAVDRAVPVTAVSLPPGGTAHAWLQVVSAANYPPGQCHPVTAAGLRVVVPGGQDASYLPHPVPACKAAIRGSGLMTVHPVQPGRARRGMAG